jgi:alkylation response protein AidB-like acyl-CoA dehydrogenase
VIEEGRLMRWEIEDTPEQQAFRRDFRDWLHETLPAGWMEAADTGDDPAVEKIKADNGFNPFAWQGMIGRSPFAAPLWPKEYGGMSGEVWMQQAIRSELVRYRLPTVSVNLLGVGLAGPTIIEHGTEEQKQRYLRKILSGEEIWCQLFSEPGSGSDLASLSTRAVRDGDEWVVNGQKVWTTIAQLSTFGMLLTRTDPDVPKHEGLTYFIVDMKSPGVEIRPLKQMTGSSEFNEVFFTDAVASDLVGEPGDGWRVAMGMLGIERGVSTFGQQLGFQREFEAMLALARQRGVADDPDIAARIADAWIGLQVLRFTADAAFGGGASGGGASGGGASGGGASGGGVEASVVKLLWAPWHQRLGELAVDVAGPSSTLTGPEYELSDEQRLFLFTRADTIYGGSNEIQRDIVAERGLGLPRG